MRARGLFYGFIVLTILIVGCEQTTVEQDMAAYCECVKEYKTATSPECVEKADAMIQKYEFDAEASEYIQKSMVNCATE